jgi:uncharacterized tellurite resistance protein B-like protein
MAAVELPDLDADERIALLAVLQRVVGADGRMSDEEREEIAELVEAFGEEGYRRSFDEAGRRFTDDEGLKEFLSALGRKTDRGEARELIMAVVLEAAIPGAVEGHQPELIDWMSDEWGIETQFEDQPDE